MDRCAKMCKYFLILSTTMFAVVGLGLAVLGIWLLIHTQILAVEHEMNKIKMKKFTIGSTMLIITGTLMMLAAVIGNRGALKKMKLALYLFSGLLSFLIIIEITESVMASVWSGSVSDELVEMYNTIYTRYQNTGDSDKTSLNKFHNAFNCCGIGEQIAICTDDSKFDCPSVIQGIFNSKTPMVVGGFLGMAGIMILALVCSVILSRRISQSHTAYTPGSEEKDMIKCIGELCVGLF